MMMPVGGKVQKREEQWQRRSLWTTKMGPAGMRRPGWFVFQPCFRGLLENSAMVMDFRTKIMMLLLVVCW